MHKVPGEHRAPRRESGRAGGERYRERGGCAVQQQPGASAAQQAKKLAEKRKKSATKKIRRAVSYAKKHGIDLQSFGLEGPEE